MKHWVGLVLALACACGRASDPAPERECITGETRLCTGAAGCQGAQTCGADGRGFGDCDCGTPPAQIRDAGEERALYAELGAKCQRDEECGPKLICWPASAQAFHGRAGGAAGGYCTSACSELAECTAIDPAAGCANGLCMRGCYSGEPAPGEGKCLDRADLTCWSSAALGITPFDARVRQSGICLPSCESDDDCDGRTCDLALQLCVDAPTAGAPIGAPCDSHEACAGRLCQPSAAGPSFCTAPCSFGTLGCGYGINADPREAMCLGTAVFDDLGSEGPGDVGICFELCDVPADCAQPGWQCITAPEVRGRSGFCGLPAASGGLDAGAEGGAP